MRAIAIVAVLMAGTAHAETVTFEADGDVIFTRCSSEPLQTICEIVFPQGTQAEEYVCVAINATGDPIGAVAAPALLFPAGAWFQELPTSEIADVKCRRR